VVLDLLGDFINGAAKEFLRQMLPDSTSGDSVIKGARQKKIVDGPRLLFGGWIGARTCDEAGQARYEPRWTGASIATGAFTACEA